MGRFVSSGLRGWELKGGTLWVSHHLDCMPSSPRREVQWLNARLMTGGRVKTCEER